MKAKRFLLTCLPIFLGVALLVGVSIGLASRPERIGLDGDVRPWSLALAANYVRGAWLNDADSQYLLGRYELDWKQDGDAALSWFRRAASAGNAEAISMVTILEVESQKSKEDHGGSGKR